MCKISSKTNSVKGDATWRMFPEPTICTNTEALLGVIQGTESADIAISKEQAEITSGGAVSPDMEETGPIQVERLTE